MVLSHACRTTTYSRDTLLAINSRHRCTIDQRVCDVLSHLHLHRRGCRAGNRQRRRALAARCVSQPGTAREIPTVIGNRVSFSTLPTRCEVDVNNDAAAAAAVSLICRVQGDHRRIESAVCQQSERSSLQPSVCPPLSSHCQSARLALPLPDKLNDASGDMSSPSPSWSRYLEVGLLGSTTTTAGPLTSPFSTQSSTSTSDQSV